MNDIRPIALTSVLMKCLEKHVLRSFIPICSPHMDPLQFAYKQKEVSRMLSYYTLTILINILIRLNVMPERFLLIFPALFNTIQPHILIPKLFGNVCTQAYGSLDF